MYQLASRCLAVSVVSAAFSTALTGCASQTPAPQQASTAAVSLETGGAIKPEYQHVTLVSSDLFFDIHPETKSLDGKSTITLSVDQAQSSFALDLDNNYRITAIQAAQYQLTDVEHKDGVVRFSTNNPVTPDEQLAVTISYQGTPHEAINAPWDGGFVWSHTDSGKPWVATAVQGEGCDLIWPCMDHPLFEAQQTDITIRVPKGLVAASNGVLVEESEGDDYSQYHWRSKQLQNNYGIALNIGPYEKLEGTYQSQYGHSYPVVFYYLAGKKDKAEKLFNEMFDQLDFFEDVIGPYPFYAEKMGVVETPHKGMEHQTINAYGMDYQPGKYGFDALLQHELAHEWFGNQVTNTDWDHMWLHEGFGTYMQPLYSEYLHDTFAYNSMMYGSRIGIRNEHPIVSNKVMSEDDVYKADRGPASDIYQKGAWILHTLRNLIGDKDFFAATRQLVYQTTDPKPGNFEPHFADTQDFIDAVNEQTGKDYTWFFQHYLYQAKLPKLMQNKTGQQLHLRWETPADAKFEMPVEIKVDGEIQTVLVGKQTATVELASSNSHYVVDPNHKILKQVDYIDAFSEFQRH